MYVEPECCGNAGTGDFALEPINDYFFWCILCQEALMSRAILFSFARQGKFRYQLLSSIE